MEAMIDDSIFEKIDNLIGRLSVSRSTVDENELCRVARVLPGDRELDVIERLKNKGDVFILLL
ncbi:hypothetical protein ACR96V_18785 [Pseudomonas aeruginosa]|uniref:hypothetical protein n=1 Tax=Pseudomonas TaxID=286 RepID=UPI00053EF51B|nr:MULTISPECIES: hypothetical protein [Pseudomonas]KSP74841.1 hypothetical protein APB20_30945 [Pseudomonas aeruginosa]MBS9732007.1 hypothetical protein [Pseudomonas aeruginosa]MBX6196532.1 hypothetical protein [Pseudomonas aeruginosa]MBX6721489.1 hypothetical protein [Pseudomonas aeruginosa]PCM93873.1 hypothetical protein CP916_33870 [Pseudomonas aeruginosa]